MKILITGLGIVGKSSFRRLLKERLSNSGWKVRHYDADRFVEARDILDEDCLLHLPECFEEKIVYLVEDIHGSTDKAIMKLSDYDLILYVQSDNFSHDLFWLSRMWAWFRAGVYSWEPLPVGWRGTNQPKDWRNLWPICKAFLRDRRRRAKWLEADFRTLVPFSYLVVHSEWSWQRPRFTIHLS